MVLFELSANSSAASVKVTSTTRSSSMNCRSLMPPEKGRITFSVNSAVGAISAPARGGQDRREQRAEEQHLRPQRRALEDQVRQDALDLARVLAGEQLRVVRVDDQRRVGDEDRHEGEARSTPRRRSGSRAIAVFSFFAEVTRWNTSCCGIEPIASVIQAATKASHSLAPPLGQNSNFPASDAAAITLPSAAGHVAHQPGDRGEADEDDHRLEQIGHRHRPHAAPDGVAEHDRPRRARCPASSDSAPPESTENTRPSAVICAEVQPR